MKIDINPYLLGMKEISALVDFFNLSIRDYESIDELTKEEKKIITPEVYNLLLESTKSDPREVIETFGI